MKYIKLFQQFRIFESSQPRKHTLCEYPEIKEDTSKQPLLLIPGGGGNPVSDYAKLAPILSKRYDIITFYYDENVRENGKEVCRKIAEQLKDKLGSRLSRLNILGFSMGTTFGFWIIKTLGDDFKGKFVCVDAAAPNAASSEQYVSMTAKHNTMRRYHCMALPIYEKSVKGEDLVPEGEEPTESQLVSFRYSYKPEILENDPKQFNFQDCTVKDFRFEFQKKYEEWRRSKRLVVEFLDKEGVSGIGVHYPSKNNPSGVWLNGEPFDVPSPSESKGISYLRSIMAAAKVDDPNEVWVVQDKYDEPDKKNYYTGDSSGENGDRQSLRDYLESQAKGMVGSLLRDPDTPETLGDVPCLFVKAGLLNGKVVDESKVEKELQENKPSDKTTFKILPGFEHSNICQHGASEIAAAADDFFRRRSD